MAGEAAAAGSTHTFTHCTRMLLSSSPLISFENEASAPVAFKLAFNYLKAGKVSGRGRAGGVRGWPGDSKARVT